MATVDAHGYVLNILGKYTLFYLMRHKIYAYMRGLLWCAFGQDWAMRRPRIVGRVTVKIPRFFRKWLSHNQEPKVNPSLKGSTDTTFDQYEKLN